MDIENKQSVSNIKVSRSGHLLFSMQTKRKNMIFFPRPDGNKMKNGVKSKSLLAKSKHLLVNSKNLLVKSISLIESIILEDDLQGCSPLRLI